MNSKQLFTFSTFSKEYEVMSGLLDDDEMVVKAQDAKIKLMTNENGIFKLEVKKCGEMFDYDMQIKAKTDAKMAKMLRFFEYGAKYLVFFSSRSLETREKYYSSAQLALFSLYIFSGKCVYFSIFE